MTTLPAPATALPLTSLLLASAMWGLAWLPLQLLRGRGIDGIVVIAIAFGTAGLVLLPALWRERARWRGQGHWLLAIAALGGFSNVSFTLAMSYGEVVRVMVLFYLLPVWGVLGGRLFLGERITPLRFGTMVAALAGAGLILGADALGDFRLGWLDWLAIACGLSFTGNNLVFRLHQGLPVKSKVGSMLLGAPLLAIAIVAVGLQSATPPSAAAAGGAALYGLMVLVATVMSQYGVTHLEAGRVAVLIILELVVAVVSAVALGVDTLTPREWAGVALVLAAAATEARTESARGVPGG
jgi:drug/metabolite transporter (DMT)-like permease